jgi:hypothetical protein
MKKPIKRVEMVNANGAIANPLLADVAIWEAAGWTRTQPKPRES